MRIRLFMAAMAASVGLATTAQAQSAEHLALADRYMAMSQSADMRQSMTGLMIEELAGADMPDDQRRWLAEQFGAMFVDVLNRTLRGMRVEVARLFTEAELRAAIAFMETPEGRSMTQKNFQFGIMLEQAMQPLLMQGMTTLFEKFCSEFSCEDAPGLTGAK